jgi:hypothetical protein
MKKTCLNCKYEPVWGEPTKGDYPHQYGKCRWSGTLPALPAVYRVYVEGITRFVKDDSGIPTNCKTWEKS